MYSVGMENEKQLGYESQKQQWAPILSTRSLETSLNFYISQAEHDTDTKLTWIDFSRRGMEGSRIINQLIDHSPYIRYTVY